MDDWRIEPWTSEHDRSRFSSGKQPLDEFLVIRVSQYEKRRLGKTFVAVPSVRGKDSQSVIGYYTLAAGSVSFKHLPRDSVRKLPKHPIPILLLARLAVDKSSQGKGLGEALLLDALQRSLSLADDLDIHAVVVEAIDDSAFSFYKKYGFVSLLDDPHHFYLPMATVRKLFG